MPANHEDYTPAELERVKRLLTEILTISPSEAAELTRAHSHEVKKLAISFEAANAQSNQNWAEAILAKVPLSAWEETYGNEFRIRPSKSASMRFLSRGEPTDDALALKEIRRALHNDLLTHMAGPLRLEYRPMLRWVETAEVSPEASDLTLSSDTAFGQCLRAVEELLSSQRHIYEQHFRENCATPLDVTIPFIASLKCSERAYRFMAAQIEQICVTESDVSPLVKESLFARVSANISCNRVLLEYSAKDARGLEAAEMCAPFLQRLNYHGLYGVPDTFFDATDGGTKYLRYLLTDWFKIDGTLVKIDPYFKRHMTESDIELIINWSHQLQELYITTRGMGGDWSARGGKEEVEKKSRAAHGNPMNRFIFAMVIAAAYYETVQTAREFTGHSKAKYSAFPARGDVAKAARNAPPIHAEELLLQAYGQVFFANDGWALHADRVVEYAQTRSAIRSHFQQLLYFAVKNRTSRQHYAMFNELRRKPEEASLSEAESR